MITNFPSLLWFPPLLTFVMLDIFMYSKTCGKRPLSKDHKLVSKTNYCLMQVKSIAECSKGSILQYFRPSLSYHLLLRSLFGLFLNGPLNTDYTVHLLHS